MRRHFISALALVFLVACDCGGEAGPGFPATADIELVVTPSASRRAISPLVYGINQDIDYASDRTTIVRAGGNRFTAYNWENNASNAGEDYCNQNDATFGDAAVGPANAFRAMLDDARARGTSAIVTVPIVDDVAADHDDLGDGGQGPPSCVGDVANSGPSYLVDRFAANHPRKGSPFAATPDLGDDAVYQDELVAYLSSHWGDVPFLVSLDNEPDLWSSTHPRIHPDPVTYAELVMRTVDFADAVKDAAPNVPTLGFVSYGYAGYVNLQAASDASGEFLSYFLGQMADAEVSTGHRLVDFVDLHWYPEAQGDGVRISAVADERGARARVEAPRSLWDPDYLEDSWIVNDVLHAPIRLLPWIRERIDAHYPGTKLAITEWNFGGGDHVSGAIATADVLGVFGREGVDLATIWLLHGDEPFTRAGLRVYTNFDGQGGAFESTSVGATTSDASRVTIYASEGASGNLVFVVLNKDDVPHTASLAIEDARAFTRVDRFVLRADSPTIDPEPSIDATGANGFLVPLPASSISVLVPAD